MAAGKIKPADNASFEEPAAAYSTDRSASNGSGLGFFKRGERVGPLEKAAFFMSPDRKTTSEELEENVAGAGACKRNKTKKLPAVCHDKPGASFNFDWMNGPWTS